MVYIKWIEQNLIINPYTLLYKFKLFFYQINILHLKIASNEWDKIPYSPSTLRYWSMYSIFKSIRILWYCTSKIKLYVYVFSLFLLSVVYNWIHSRMFPNFFLICSIFFLISKIMDFYQYKSRPGTCYTCSRINFLMQFKLTGSIFWCSICSVSWSSCFSLTMFSWQFWEIMAKHELQTPVIKKK